METMMKRLLMMAVLLAAPAAAWTETYELDPNHTTIAFSIRHMMVSNVHGHFGSFSGNVVYDEKDMGKWSAQATIDTASIDTGIAKRDAHLRTPDYFDAVKFPKIEFKSTGVEKGKDGALKLKGDLTLHGVTKPVVLDLEVNGISDEPKMGKRAGFTAHGKIDRRDFGINNNMVLKAGGLAVGYDVKIEIDVEAVLKEDKPEGKEAAKK
jgi:polyisoprenoid-binding protein YceI